MPKGSYRLRLPSLVEAGPGYITERDFATPSDICLTEVLQDDAPVLGDEVEIGGSTTSVTLILRRSTTQIQGKVVDSSGQDASSVTVVLVPDDRGRERDYAAMTTDQHGKFEFTCATAGSYQLYAWNELWGPTYRSEEFMTKYKELGTPIRIAEGERLTIQPRLLD
jgi:hypothetical protein